MSELSTLWLIGAACAAVVILFAGWGPQIWAWLVRLLGGGR